MKHQSAAVLPASYAALEPFVRYWALPTSAARSIARSRSTAAERRAFYDAALPVAAEALAALDARPLAELGSAERRLLDLLLSFAHVSLAVEVHGSNEEWHSHWRDRMVVTGAPADRAA